MAVVMDASAAIAFALNETLPDTLGNAIAAALLDEPVVPALWRYEFANILVTSVRRKRITQEFCEQKLDQFAGLPFHHDGNSNEQILRDCVNLATDHKLTVYDASYLELAVRLKLPLVTLDGPLGAAARAEGVEVVDRYY